MTSLIIDSIDEEYLRKDFKFAAVGQEENVKRLLNLLEDFDSVVVERTDFDDETRVSVAATKKVFSLLAESLTDAGYTFDQNAFNTNEL